MPLKLFLRKAADGAISIDKISKLNHAIQRDLKLS